uniref:Gastrula zinc finger protein xFG20-1 n=2 Tax=Cacopsylla melanoneura TaxID=428564 RepID=A0A8D8LT16_9HEMI
MNSRAEVIEIKDEPDEDEYAAFHIKEESLDIIDVREETIEDELRHDEMRVKQEFGEEYITDESYYSGYAMEEEVAQSQQSSNARRFRKSKYNKVPPNVMSEALAEIAGGAKFAATGKKYNISEGVLRYQAKRQESRNLTLSENDKKATVITPDIDFALSQPQSRLHLNTFTPENTFTPVKYEPSSPEVQYISEDFDVGASVTVPVDCELDTSSSVPVDFDVGASVTVPFDIDTSATVPVSCEKKYNKVPPSIMRAALADIQRGAKISKTAKKFNISDAVLRYQAKKDQSRNSSFFEKDERSVVKALDKNFGLSQSQSTSQPPHRKKIKLQHKPDDSSSTSEYMGDNFDSDPSVDVPCEVTVHENVQSFDPEGGIAAHNSHDTINRRLSNSNETNPTFSLLIDDDKYPYSCNFCTKRFSRKGDLQRHYTEVHDDVRYPCTQCSITFTRKSNLQAHMMSMHVGIKHIHTCPECDKTFTRKSDLGRHLAIHRGVKFACAECPKSFNQKSSLFRHVEMVHRGMKFYCKYCSLYFLRESSLQTHYEQKHPTIVLDSFEEYELKEECDDVKQEPNSTDSCDSIEETCEIIEEVCDTTEETCSATEETCNIIEEPCDNIEEPCDFDDEQPCDINELRPCVTIETRDHLEPESESESAASDG